MQKSQHSDFELFPIISMVQTYVFKMLQNTFLKRRQCRIVYTRSSKRLFIRGKLEKMFGKFVRIADDQTNLDREIFDIKIDKYKRFLDSNTTHVRVHWNTEDTVRNKDVFVAYKTAQCAHVYYFLIKVLEAKNYE